MKKRILLVPLALLLIASLVACAAPAPTETIKIGCIGPLTGPLADLQGKNVFGGMDTAIKEINDAGGILGRTVEGIKIHEGTTGEEVVSAFKEAISAGVKGITGGSETGTTESACPMIRDSGIPTVIGIASIVDPLTPGYSTNIFHLAAYPAQYQLAVKAVIEEKGLKTLGVLSIDAGYGHQVADNVESWWPSKTPADITDIVYYTWGTTDMGPEVTKLVAGNPDAVFVGVWGEATIGGVIKKLKELEYEGTIFFDVAGVDEEVIKALGADRLEGTYTVAGWVADESVPESVKFATAFEELVGRKPNYHAALCYTATKALLLAMEKAGTVDDATKITDAMWELDFKTPWGDNIWFFPGNQMYTSWSGLVQVQGGKLVTAIIGPIAIEDFTAPIDWYSAYLEAGGK